MSLTRKDLATVVPMVLVVLVYAANTREWDVPLLSSNRWAAGAVFVLGMVTCGLGRPAEDTSSPAVVAMSLLGGAALVLFVLALWTGAQWALALLALATLVLWVGATLRHATLTGGRPLHPA